MIDLMPGETASYIPREVVTAAETGKAEAAQERQGALVFIMAAEARRAYDPKKTDAEKKAMAPAERSAFELGKYLAAPPTDKAVEPTQLDPKDGSKDGVLKGKERCRFKINGNVLTPIASDETQTAFAALDTSDTQTHELVAFDKRTPDGRINIIVRGTDGTRKPISVDEATFVEIYMLGCQADFDSLDSQDKIGSASFLKKDMVQQMMGDFIREKGDWTKIDTAKEVSTSTKKEVVYALPIIHGFEPAAVAEAGAKVAELKAKLPAGDDSRALEAKLTPLTAAKVEAQNKLTQTTDESKRPDLQRALTEATAAEQKAKDDLELRQAQEKALAEAEALRDKLKAGSAELAKDPPSDEALTTHINTLIEGDVQAKVNTLQGEILVLKGEIRELLANNLDGAKDKANALQKQLDAKQAEIDNYKLMTEHPEMTAAFVRQMQRGEVSKDVVDKIQKALDQGNASDLVKEFSSEAFKDKLEELKKKIDMSKDPKMKDFFEKYRPYLVTGGIAVFLLYQIIIQAMNKEDRNGGH